MSGPKPCILWVYYLTGKEDISDVISGEEPWDGEIVLSYLGRPILIAWILEYRHPFLAVVSLSMWQQKQGHIHGSIRKTQTRGKGS